MSTIDAETMIAYLEADIVRLLAKNDKLEAELKKYKKVQRLCKFVTNFDPEASPDALRLLDVGERIRNILHNIRSRSSACKENPMAECAYMVSEMIVREQFPEIQPLPCERCHVEDAMKEATQ